MSFVVIFIMILGVAVALLSWLIIRMVAAPRHTKAVNEQLKQGKVANAIRSSKALIQKDPRNGEAHWLLAQAYLQDNKPELALMELKQVGAIAQFGAEVPEAPFRARIAELYERFNQQEDALKERILLTKLDPKAAVNYFHVGRLFEARGRTDVAVGNLRKALELDPRLAQAHHQLGLILYRTKRPMEAKTELELAIKYDGEDYEAFYYLGKLFKEMNDFTGALLAFEKSTRSPAFKIKALVERGGCYMSQNALDKAIPELERAVKLVKDEGSTEALYGRYFLAMCYEKQRDLDKAIEQWEKIYQKKASFRDVAEKLTQYQEYRTDDKMKDYLTCGKEEFMETCSGVVQKTMSLSIRGAEDIPNGVDIIAVEGDSEKWLGTKKQPRLIRFLRMSENIDEGVIRGLIEKMKTLGVTRGAVVTSSAYSRPALEYAENRSVELFTKEQLQEMLTKGTGRARG